MSDLKELIKYIEVLEAEPFTGWTGGNKKGYLTACTSIKKKALKILESKANGADKSTDLALHKHIVSGNEVALKSFVHFCMNNGYNNINDFELAQALIDFNDR